MRVIDEDSVFSATDLVGFLAREHLSGLELDGATCRAPEAHSRPGR
jgi:hypothetical protein